MKNQEIFFLFKENYIIYEKIMYGFSNFGIKYDEIKLIKENKNFKNKILIDNYNKFFNFLQNDDNAYNVTCIYSFSDSIKNRQSRFNENNIFINGIKSEGF